MILAQAMEKSCRHIEILPDSSVSAYARATLKVSEQTAGRLVLAYDPRYEAELGYLVAHESGHLIRMYGVPEDARLVPVTSGKHYARVLEESQPTLRRLRLTGIPDEGLATLVRMWLDGIVRQVCNYPADMRIERWMRTSYPGLAGLQEHALRNQVQSDYEALNENVLRATHPKIYHASIAMNSAFARYMAKLLYSRAVFSLYRRTAFGDLGRRLGDEIWESADKGYRSDVEDAKRWAKRFRLEEWFEWKLLSDVQETH